MEEKVTLLKSCQYKKNFMICLFPGKFISFPGIISDIPGFSRFLAFPPYFPGFPGTYCTFQAFPGFSRCWPPCYAFFLCLLPIHIIILFLYIYKKVHTARVIWLVYIFISCCKLYAQY